MINAFTATAAPRLTRAAGKPFLHAMLIVGMAFLALPALAKCNAKDQICAAGSIWSTANVVDFTVSQPESAYRSHMLLTIPDRLNLVIDLDTTLANSKEVGTIRLVEGGAMLTRGLTLEEGYEIDALDAPVLMYQMLASLLAQAAPGGPEKLTGTRHINIHEKKKSIIIGTMSAGGNFGAPWHLTGNLAHKDAESVTFKLSYTFTQERRPSTIHLEGTWKKLRQAPTLDTAMLLDGWQLHLLGPVEIKQENGSILDYSAQSTPMPVRTLGELQQLIREKQKAQQPAPAESAPASQANLPEMPATRISEDGRSLFVNTAAGQSEVAVLDQCGTPATGEPRIRELGGTPKAITITYGKHCSATLSLPSLTLQCEGCD